MTVGEFKKLLEEHNKQRVKEGLEPWVFKDKPDPEEAKKVYFNFVKYPKKPYNNEASD